MANHRCAVLGKPVAHSLSPVLHNAAYRSLKLDDWLYDKHEVGEDDLDAFLKGLDSTWAGLSMRWVAAVLFIIAASTDKIDGWMARKYNQVTEMGKLMDPIADKLLTCGAMIVCSAFGELGWWVTILFLIREIGITVMRFFVMERPGGKVIAAAWPGKLKTVFQCVGLSMLLLPFWSLGNGQATPFWMTAYYFLTYAIIYVALVLCLYSGAVYLYNTFVAPKRK